MQPISLSAQQQTVIDLAGNVLVSACPGSGKTRVLTAKVLREANRLSCRHHKVAALTFTARAAEEISSRLREAGYLESNVWTGTIHAFAIEWILRPYACYHNSLKGGFSLADEFKTKSIIDSLRDGHGVGERTEVITGLSRQGDLLVQDTNIRSLVTEYRHQLHREGLIDFDEALFFAYSILRNSPEICRTLATMFRLLCLDEFQDTQDLQYGILSEIVKQSGRCTHLFIVGDRNQAIYASLGSVDMNAEKLQAEFLLDQLHYRELSGNYRSTQRIIDFCSNFANTKFPVLSMASHASEPGLITYSRGLVDKDDLPQEIASLIQFHLITGVRDSEICILGPTWEFIIALGRRLAVLLPDVSFDAPGLSPLRYQQDSVWFKLARILLTQPSPKRFHARNRWAADFLRCLEQAINTRFPEDLNSARQLLRVCNAIRSENTDGLLFLQDAFGQFFKAFNISEADCPSFFASRDDFLDGARDRIRRNNMASDVESMQRMFQFPSGVVVNTCHGVKGEEFEVVICFGILRGRIPHWNRIFDESVDESLDARRMLYVIASRAKKHLHLYSESGRTTLNGGPYHPTQELRQLVFGYDFLGSII